MGTHLFDGLVATILLAWGQRVFSLSALTFNAGRDLYIGFAYGMTPLSLPPL